MIRVDDRRAEATRLLRVLLNPALLADERGGDSEARKLRADARERLRELRRQRREGAVS